MRMNFLTPLAASILIVLGISSETAAQRRGNPPLDETFYRGRPLRPIQTERVKDTTEVLFEKLAPWVFVEYRRVEGHPSGRFLNTTTRQKTDWLRPGQTLEGARVAVLNPNRARLVYGQARQDLLFVPEKSPRYDPSRKRTPEEIAAAQRRYSEFFMKKFIVSGKEYARQRGNPSAPQHQWYPKP